MQLLPVIQHAGEPTGPRMRQVRAVEQITRISLGTLLSGSTASAGEIQDLLALLRGSPTVTARVTNLLPTGEHLIDFSTSGLPLRLTMKLNSAHAPSDVLVVSLSEPPDVKLLSPEVRLSSSAQLIQELIKPVNKQLVAESHATPALAKSPHPADTLAKALQQTVRTSGLFYESHLLGWLNGNYPLEDLLTEPQAIMSPLPQDGLADTADSVIHPQLTPLVRQQLDTYAQQTLSWHGNVWPDQPAQIEITGDDTETESASRLWSVRINLNLPALGAVQTHISLTGQTVTVGLQASHGTAPLLSAASGHLAESLSAQGLRVNPISVQNHV